MILIAVALLCLLAVSGLVMAYVAYVDRGETIPHAPRLTDAMIAARRRVDEFMTGETQHDEHRETTDSAV